MMKKRFLDGLLTESVWFTKQETSVFPSEGAVGKLVPHLHPLPYLGLPEVGEEAKDPWLLEYYWETFHTGQPHKGLNTEYESVFIFITCQNKENQTTQEYIPSRFFFFFFFFGKKRPACTQ